MNVINFNKIICFDVDDTLIFQDCPYKIFQNADLIIHVNQIKTPIWIHQKHIEHLKKLKENGYSIWIWSQQGSEWAEYIVKELNLQNFIDIISTKPEKMFDDLSLMYWSEICYLPIE